MTILSRDSMRVPLLVWDGDGAVPMEPAVFDQLARTCSMPFVHHHAALMPDAHVGIGCSVGSVIPTKGAIVPAAVGVDLGCGVAAVPTSLGASDLPDSLAAMRSEIERRVPHGRTHDGQAGDRGAWDAPPATVTDQWRRLNVGWQANRWKTPEARSGRHGLAARHPRHWKSLHRGVPGRRPARVGHAP